MLYVLGINRNNHLLYKLHPHLYIQIVLCSAALKQFMKNLDNTIKEYYQIKYKL